MSSTSVRLTLSLMKRCRARFIHGFNLGKKGTVAREVCELFEVRASISNNLSSTSSLLRKSLLESVTLVCTALQKASSLLYWELGNEPDLFPVIAQGPVRPPTRTDYVAEWPNGTRAIRQVIKTARPQMADPVNYKFVASSFAGANSIGAWKAGLDVDNNIALISSHNYIGSPTQPGVTLRGTLMNHTRTVLSVSAHVKEKNQSAQLNHTQPYILGETNSLYHQGAPNLSDSFGGALGNVDFLLYCASVGIGRVHMHQGTNYRYQSWQPVTTDQDTEGTKPPFHGNLTVAAALNQEDDGAVRVQNLPMGNSETVAVYAVHNEDVLKRVVLINRDQYNATITATTATPGADSTGNVAFSGVSYDHEKRMGKPVRVAGISQNERVKIGKDGAANIEVPASSPVVVQVQCYA
ncbi:hypothetical protein HDV00_000613 [Rhizophlyctis rosea]|nr:hypothetical protein HDV00_000613 [Rhizophlyctis rosea]